MDNTEIMREEATRLARELYPDDWHHHVSNLEIAMLTGSLINMQIIIEGKYRLPTITKGRGTHA